jgi:hypothetical protein
VSHSDTPGQTDTQAIVAEELKACSFPVSHRAVRHGQERGRSGCEEYLPHLIAKLCFATGFSRKWDDAHFFL